MRFKAILYTSFRVLTPNLTGCRFEFTKSQILFPKSLDPCAVKDSDIRNGVHYQLEVSDNLGEYSKKASVWK